MAEHHEGLLDDALKLAPEARAELAAAVLASLDGEPEDDAETAWAEEIQRRVRRLERHAAVERRSVSKATVRQQNRHPWGPERRTRGARTRCF